MKSIFGFLFVILLALTGGLYFTRRPATKRTSDWQRVKNVPTAIGDYVRRLFATKAVDDTPAANAAYLLASWGMPTAFAGAVGDDDYGRRVVEGASACCWGGSFR